MTLVWKDFKNLSNVKTSRGTDADKLILKIFSSENHCWGWGMRLRPKFLEDFMLTKTNSEVMKVLPWLPRKCLKFLWPRKFGKTSAKKDGLDELIGTVKMIWLELTEPPIGFSWSKYLKRLEPYISRLKRWNSKFDRFQNHKHVSFSAILLNPSQDHSQSVDCVVWNFLFCQQLHLFQDSLQLSTFWLMHQFLFIVFTYRSSQLDWQVWAKIKSSWAGFVGRDINLHSVQIHRWE